MESNSSNILYDHIPMQIEFGEFTGAIFIKLKPSTEPIIFSEKVIIEPDYITTTGLHVGIHENKAFSVEKKNVMIHLSTVDYCVRLSPELTKEFDRARFSASFPNIVRFLHTACVYLETEENLVNHLDFVAGEILSRPVAITHDNGIALSDRLVVDEQNQLTFYDTIIIHRDQTQQLLITYEDFITMPLKIICSISILGTENF